jgi:hypothetical protein
VSLTFTGTGALDHDAGHTTFCGDGFRECQSVRVSAHRAAVARFGLGELSGQTTIANVFYGHGVDAAAPKFAFDEY